MSTRWLNDDTKPLFERRQKGKEMVLPRGCGRVKERGCRWGAGDEKSRRRRQVFVKWSSAAIDPNTEPNTLCQYRDTRASRTTQDTRSTRGTRPTWRMTARNPFDDLGS